MVYICQHVAQKGHDDYEVVSMLRLLSSAYLRVDLPEFTQVGRDSYFLKTDSGFGLAMLNASRNIVLRI